MKDPRLRLELWLHRDAADSKSVTAEAVLLQLCLDLSHHNEPQRRLPSQSPWVCITEVFLPCVIGRVAMNPGEVPEPSYTYFYQPPESALYLTSWISICWNQDSSTALQSLTHPNYGLQSPAFVLSHSLHSLFSPVLLRLPYVLTAHYEGAQTGRAFSADHWAAAPDPLLPHVSLKRWILEFWELAVQLVSLQQSAASCVCTSWRTWGRSRAWSGLVNGAGAIYWSE